MSKLFVFGIGGTGSRVIKSLAMLLASGVKINATEVVPIIIDVDKPNQDLTRTVEILKLYESINQTIRKPEYSGFFSNSISNLYPIDGKEFKLEIQDVQGKKFGEYIDHQTLDDRNKRLVDLLFTEKNLDLDMQKGFQGNPNLGSVVLNQFKANADFVNFARNFVQGDRIFIISSIHGGTGSAGFPLLVKNLRNADVPLPNPHIIKNSIIGAITVLPYFKLKDGEIKSADFISKAKAALEYYIKNVNPSLNSLYYIGYDEIAPNYDNHVGGTDQENPAHFVELAAALSVIDFMNKGEAQMQSLGRSFMEFGVQDFENFIDFKTLGSSTFNMLFRPMTQYYFFVRYLDYQLTKSLNKQPWSNRGKGNQRITSSFLTSEGDFYNKIERFNYHFKSWLKELSENRPAFMPFDLKGDIGKYLDAIFDFHPKAKPMFHSDFSLFDDYLNMSEKQVKGRTLEGKFIDIFSQATSHLVDNHFR